MTRDQSSDSSPYFHILLSVIVVGLLIRLMEPSHASGDRVHVGPGPIVTSSYVWDDLNGNGVQDPGEPPISGVRVYIYAFGQDKEIGSSLSDERGRCELRFRGIPGRYWLRFEPPAGYAFTITKRGKDDRLDSEAGPDGTTAPFFTQGLIQHVDAGLLRQEPPAALRAQSDSAHENAARL